jgi:hypothetical protein
LKSPKKQDLPSYVMLWHAWSKILDTLSSSSTTSQKKDSSDGTYWMLLKASSLVPFQTPQRPSEDFAVQRTRPAVSYYVMFCMTQDSTLVARQLTEKKDPWRNVLMDDWLARSCSRCTRFFKKKDTVQCQKTPGSITLYSSRLRSRHNSSEPDQ